MSFKLSRRSLDRLEGIDERLQAVVKMAITADQNRFRSYAGYENPRTTERTCSREGRIQTIKSKHLDG